MMDREALETVGVAISDRRKFPNELGPFLNDDGDWWVPATIPYLKARDLVVGCLSYETPDDGTLVYKGKGKTHLCTGGDDHEVGPSCDAACDLYVLAYHWEENRKW